jgi:RNA polymerase sigma-70 factor (ECF subfamily)
MADSEALFVANHDRLFRYFCRAVGRAETARDLTQEVFLRVSRTAVPTAGDGALRGWLFRIARNLALDHHRSRRRHPEPSALVDEPTRSSSQDVSLAVNQALASLQALDRDVFLMREVAGLGYDEIAGACELTPDGVRSRIHRTRLQLRDQLAAPIATFQTMTASDSGKTHGSSDQ